MTKDLEARIKADPEALKALTQIKNKLKVLPEHDNLLAQLSEEVVTFFVNYHTRGAWTKLSSDVYVSRYGVIGYVAFLTFESGSSGFAGFIDISVQLVSSLRSLGKRPYEQFMQMLGLQQEVLKKGGGVGLPLPRLEGLAFVDKSYYTVIHPDFRIPRSGLDLAQIVTTHPDEVQKYLMSLDAEIDSLTRAGPIEPL